MISINTTIKTDNIIISDFTNVLKIITFISFASKNFFLSLTNGKIEGTDVKYLRFVEPCQRIIMDVLAVDQHFSIEQKANLIVVC